MQSIKSLLSLEFKSRYGNLDFKSKSGIIKFISVALFALLFYTIYIWVMRNLIYNFYIYDMQNLFLVIFITVSSIGLLFFGISSVTKNLYFSGDNEILLRFPVKIFEVFISKILMLLIIQLVITNLVMLPTLIMFGYITHQAASYFFMMPFVILMSVLSPFLTANILAIPSMYLKLYLKNKYITILVITIIIVAGGFALYMLSIQGVLNFMSARTMNFFSDGFLSLINDIFSLILPFKQLTNLLFLNDVLMSLLIVFAVFIVLFLGDYLIIKKVYFVTIYKNLEVMGSSFKKVTKNKQRGFFRAIIHREFIEIFRSSNYSFQYLVMAFGAPVMVYFCNRLANQMGKTQIGAGVLPALSMLVLLIFVTIIVSFSATSISREGNNFYQTKTCPVPYKIQISVKLALYLFVAFLSVFLSCLVLIIFNFVTPVMGIMMFFSCLLFATAETCISIKMDIVKPSFAIGGDSELTDGTPNTFYSLFIGFIIAVFAGVFCMVFGYIINLNVAFMIITGLSLILAGFSVFVLYLHIDKYYDRITHR